MNFSFLSPIHGPCLVKLWATGRFGFSLPKKVEITAPSGETSTFLYFNRKVGLKYEHANRTIVRIAIAQFLASDSVHQTEAEIDDAVPPFTGTLTPIRSSAPPPPPARVRPGRAMARNGSSRTPRSS